MDTETALLRRPARRARRIGRSTRYIGRGAGGGTQRVLVGGVNSPVRAYRQIGGRPVVLARSRGASVWDARGRRLTDWIMGWGALILGHQAPPVTAALRARVREGVLLGLTGPHEGQLAQLISEAVPGVEQVRFTASGTEACMTAVRLARAHTGRPKVLLCQGAYHGHADTLLAGLSAGVPEALEQTLVRVPFNNVGGLEKALAAEGARIACAILEPVAANCGVIPPAPGYLARARELTARHGALLIFDEVVTGFRLGPAGAQGLYGVRPDLTVFGKIIGGGLPIGALAGPRRLMQHLAPEGPVYHAGTFAGHPLSMAAGVATLRCLRREPPYGALERLGRALEQDVCEAAGRAGVPVCVNRVGSMLTAFFSQRPVRDAADAAAADRDRFALWARGLLDERILVPPSPLEAMFVSTAHRAADVERLVEATARCLKRAGRRRRQGA